MGDPGRHCIACGHLVDQHHVELQVVERLQQIANAARTQHNLHVAAFEHRAQEIDLKVARQGGQRPDAQDPTSGARSCQRADQLVAAGEYRVGVVQRDAAGLGEFQPPSAPLEQIVTEPVLQLADLHRER